MRDFAIFVVVCFGGLRCGAFMCMPCRNNSVGVYALVYACVCVPVWACAHLFLSPPRPIPSVPSFHIALLPPSLVASCTRVYVYVCVTPLLDFQRCPPLSVFPISPSFFVPPPFPLSRLCGKVLLLVSVLFSCFSPMRVLGTCVSHSRHLVSLSRVCVCARACPAKRESTINQPNRKRTALKPQRVGHPPRCSHVHHHHHSTLLFSFCLLHFLHVTLCGALLLFFYLCYLL